MDGDEEEDEDEDEDDETVDNGGDVIVVHGCGETFPQLSPPPLAPRCAWLCSLA